MIYADLVTTPQRGTAQVLFLIAAILFGIAALAHLFAPAPGPQPGPRYWGWTPALVDAGLCLVGVGFLLGLP
jgi:hypothetical protein